MNHQESPGGVLCKLNFLDIILGDVSVVKQQTVNANTEGSLEIWDFSMSKQKVPGKTGQVSHPNHDLPVANLGTASQACSLPV